jgi:hypothetical protein
MFFVVLGALVLGAVALLVLPGLLAEPPRPTRQPTASPGPTTDPHAVITPAGVVTFGLEGSDIVIRRTPAGGPTSELGRITVPESTRPAASGDTFTSSGGFAMVCPAADGSMTDGFFFGYVDPAGGITYAGPAALGQGAPDGLFLFTVSTATLDPSTKLEAKSKGGALGISVATFGFAITEGHKQPSGCFVSE